MDRNFLYLDGGTYMVYPPFVGTLQLYVGTFYCVNHTSVRLTLKVFLKVKTLSNI